MKSSGVLEVDYVVIGCGVAGLRAAIELASAGKVLILSKSLRAQSMPESAHGCAAALSDEDEIGLHYQETINAGDGLCQVSAVKVLVDEGRKQIHRLIEWSSKLGRNGGKLAFSREAAHSRSRVLHAHGQATGHEIHNTLFQKAQSLGNIRMLAHALITDLLRDDRRIRGVCYLDEKNHALHEVRAQAVLLATGGLGQVFRETTNPPVSTGDGLAVAYRAGATLADMEFIQFHPTTLFVKCAPRFPLPEALRAEGACLRNVDLQRFMHRYHEASDVAPREAVARAIMAETARTGSDFVYLDLTTLEADFIQKRFPRVYATCLNYNLDISTDLVPIHAAAHYAMGGVKSDLDGRTSLEGLYAAGEVACTGVHGANRLASNSLLEALVFGALAGRTMVNDHHPTKRRSAAVPASGNVGPTAFKNASAVGNASPSNAEMLKLTEEIRELAWKQIGIIRCGKDLAAALERLENLEACLPAKPRRRDYEAANMATVARLIAECALAREESRGGHYRSDFPFRVDDKLQKHSVISRGAPVNFE